MLKNGVIFCRLFTFTQTYICGIIVTKLLTRVYFMKKTFFLFSKEAKGPGYVPNIEILSYATGLAGQNLTYSYISQWLRYFCINLLHMKTDKVGTIFALSNVWDAINEFAKKNIIAQLPMHPCECVGKQW